MKKIKPIYYLEIKKMISLLKKMLIILNSLMMIILEQYQVAITKNVHMDYVYTRTKYLFIKQLIKILKMKLKDTL